MDFSKEVDDFRIYNQMYCLITMKKSGIINEYDFAKNMINIAKMLKIDFDVELRYLNLDTGDIEKEVEDD